MPFRLTLRRHFVADHFHDLPGFVEERHGHNWEVEATVTLDSETREPALEAALDRWVKAADYRVLNELPELAGRNPTAEAMAQWALEHLRAEGFEAQAVRVREKANYWALCRSGMDA